MAAAFAREAGVHEFYRTYRRLSTSASSDRMLHRWVLAKAVVEAAAARAMAATLDSSSPCGSCLRCLARERHGNVAIWTAVCGPSPRGLKTPLASPGAGPLSYVRGAVERPTHTPPVSTLAICGRQAATCARCRHYLLVLFASQR